MPKAKKLRAVGYCRTSGEKQRNNTSIPNQRAAIEAACSANGWKFVRHYVDEAKSGAKTEGRAEFQRMLRDAANGAFDVIVPFDATRFARDGVDILETAKFLRVQFGILTIDTKGQFDNRDHRNSLQNFVQAGVSEHERLTIMERTQGGRVRRARENVPTTGRLPFGRTFDRTTNEWGIDEEKAVAIRKVADRVLGGESLRTVAQDFPYLSYPTLQKVLARQCGNTWEVHFRSPEIGLDEPVVHDVPPLLDASTIRAVHRRLAENRRFVRNSPAKNDYLLGGHVFCAGCGYAMTGAVRPSGVRPSGVRLYRHNFRKNGDCPFDPKPSVRAEDLEGAVVRDLFNMLGDPVAREQALAAGQPKVDEEREELERVERELVDVESARERFLTLIEHGSLTVAKAKAKLDGLNDREARLLERQRDLEARLSNVLDSADLQRLAVDVFDKVFTDADGNDVRVIAVTDGGEGLLPGSNDVGSFVAFMADGENKRRLVEAAFGGSLADGGRPGVYVTPDGGEHHGPKSFTYQLRGSLLPFTHGGATLAAPGGRTR